MRLHAQHVLRSLNVKRLLTTLVLKAGILNLHLKLVFLVLRQTTVSILISLLVLLVSSLTLNLLFSVLTALLIITVLTHKLCSLVLIFNGLSHDQLLVMIVELDIHVNLEDLKYHVHGMNGTRLTIGFASNAL